MKTPTLQTIVEDDAKIMGEFVAQLGEVPPVLFFHFNKAPRKIANFMNKVPAGKMPVKNGFFLSLNDPVLMENRFSYMASLGLVFAAMVRVGLMEKPTSVVFCSEGWASEKQNIKPSKDPKARDVFITAGLNAAGESFVDMKEKKIKLTKEKDETKLTAELVALELVAFVPKKGEPDQAQFQSPLLEAFFGAYEEGEKKIANDEKSKKFKKFLESAEGDPIDTLRQALEAAKIMTFIQAFNQR